MSEQAPIPVSRDRDPIIIENPSPQTMVNAIGSPYQRVGDRITIKPEFADQAAEKIEVQHVESLGSQAVAGAIGQAELQVGAEEFPGMFDPNFNGTPEDAAVREPFRSPDPGELRKRIEARNNPINH